ncbi:MAG: hypothetical protein JWR19_1423 [Pedosphaera sp.]|nr:hypothetical protein [Pedosphaera sp.]
MATPVTTPYLEMRFHLSDGSLETFIQENEAVGKRILDTLRPGQLFKQNRIMLAGTYSVTAIVPSYINKIDFICPDFVCWEFPVNLSDVVEIPKGQFRERAGLDDPSRLVKRNQQRVTGDAFVGFLDLEMKSGLHVHLMIEGAVELPADRFNRIQLLLSGTSIHVRLPGKGMSILNLANLIRFTTYPGPPETPTDAWIAHRRHAT